MKYSVAQLKRDAKVGILEAEMIIRCGEKCTPENLVPRLQGRRKIVDSNTVAIFFLNADGKKSELQIPKASLVEYTDEMLTIYFPGYRKPNAKEQKILDEWNAITETKQYQNQLEIDCLSDGSSTYYQKRAFFNARNANYLMGFDEERGLRLDVNKRNAGHEDIIRDASIRGMIAMQYKLYRK